MAPLPLAAGRADGRDDYELLPHCDLLSRTRPPNYYTASAQPHYRLAGMPRGEATPTRLRTLAVMRRLAPPATIVSALRSAELTPGPTGAIQSSTDRDLSWSAAAYRGTHHGMGMGMERADWLDDGLNSADARFLMLTAITHHQFSSPNWGEHEVRKLHAELAEIDQQASQAAVEHAELPSADRRTGLFRTPR